MKFKFILIIIILFGFKSFSQISGSNKVWLSGYDCCSNPLFQGIKLDFSSGNPTANTFTWHMDFCETNGQFFDSNNNLLFCTNGVYIANSLDDTMQNGGGLNPSAYTTARNSTGLYLIQGNLVIPFPGDTNKFILFHHTIDDNINYNIYHAYYSVIDMSLNAGLGAVIQKNIVILTDTFAGGFTATKHANGRDWWVIVNKGGSGIVFKFLVTPYNIQTFSQDLIYGFYHPGQMVFTRNGDKFASYDPNDDLEIWDFDRCTGMFSNRVHVDINDNASLMGAAFSNSGRYLYISSSGPIAYLYQFDMYASDIGQSKRIISTTTSGTSFYLSQLGPDNKIYIIGDARKFHVINKPDSLNCQFCRDCVQLPAYNCYTIPNHPNYSLGSVLGSICDSITTSINNINSLIEPFYLFPNPANTFIYITQNGGEIIESIRVYNSIGQLQKEPFISTKTIEYAEVNTSDLKSGIYFIEMQTKQKIVSKKFVIN